MILPSLCVCVSGGGKTLQIAPLTGILSKQKKNTKNTFSRERYKKVKSIRISFMIQKEYMYFKRVRPITLYECDPCKACTLRGSRHAGTHFLVCTPSVKHTANITRGCRPLPSTLNLERIANPVGKLPRGTHAVVHPSACRRIEATRITKSRPRGAR